MAKDDFDEVLDRYFNDGSWTLFVAICLLQKIDPKERKGTITHQSTEGGDDPTTRPYKVALSALKKAQTGIAAVELNQVTTPDEDQVPPLYEIDHDPEAEGAARHYVDPREFVRWACKRWPNATDHLARAERRYQKKKSWKFFSTVQREELALKELLAIVKESDPKNMDPKTESDSEWARRIEPRLRKKYGGAWKQRRTRAAIRSWKDEGKL